MKIRQWEIWKSRPPGFERDHWFVIVSGQERLDNPQHRQINGLACFYVHVNNCRVISLYLRQILECDIQ